MYFYKIVVGFLLYLVSTTSFAHVTGITDTAINVNADSISLVYTLPFENINELTDKQKSALNNTVMQGFLVENKTNIQLDTQTNTQVNSQVNSQANTQAKACSGILLSRHKLEDIHSEQFHIRYTCDEKLANVSIAYSLFFSKNENHKNHVRLSIAGRSQSFIYSSTKKLHVLPVDKLLKGWDATLIQSKKSATTALSNQYQLSNNVTSLGELLMQSTHYFLIGVEHILLGYDHVLFLIGLLLLPLSFRSIVLVATSFTLAHSITLGLSVFEVFTLPAPYVEAIIALSIVYIAIDNIRVLKRNNPHFSTQNKALVPWQKRSLITFLFGLLHGFGFSYVLKEIGLGDHVVGSLLFFNLGVEFGQLLIIAVCFPILWYTFRKVWGTKLAIALSILVGLMGFFWLTERVYSLV